MGSGTGSGGGSSPCASAVQYGTTVTKITGNTVFLSKPLLGPIDKENGVVMFSAEDPTANSNDGPDFDETWASFNTDGDDTHLTESEFTTGLQSMFGAAVFPDSIASCMFSKADTEPAGNPLIA